MAAVRLLETPTAEVSITIFSSELKQFRKWTGGLFGLCSQFP